LVKYICVLVVIFCCVRTFARADTIYFKKGRAIEGTVTSDKNGVVTVREDFGDFGYSESHYNKENVDRVEVPKPVITLPTGVKVSADAPLTERIQAVLAKGTQVTRVTVKNKICSVKYYFPTTNEEAQDRAIVEKNIFGIMAVLTDKDMENAETVDIEASTVGLIRKGIIATARITKKQLAAYKANPQKAKLQDVADFKFTAGFY